MRNEALAERYTVALFSLSEEQGCFVQVLNELQSVNTAIIQHGDLQAAFISPSVAVESKIAVFKEFFGAEISELTLHFFMLLFNKGREGIIGDIVALFRNKVNEKLNIATVKVRVARALDDVQETLFTTSLMKLTGKRVDLEVEVCPELLAGAVIQIGESFYDGSLKHQFDNIGALLKTTPLD